jgi:hypothetical protein
MAVRKVWSLVVLLLTTTSSLLHLYFVLSHGVKAIPSIVMSSLFSNSYSNTVSHGAMAAQMVETLHYKPAGRGFDYRWCQWIFSLA